MKIVAISDTHNRHDKLIIPECDLLIHAGDWTGGGYETEVRNFAKWLNKQNQANHIVVIPGNHELDFEQNLPDSKQWFYEECPRAKLLIDEGCEIDGIKIWGSPVQPWFHDWAWNRAKDLYESHIKGIPEIKPHWDIIPDDTNILITHGPPYNILDKTIFKNEPLGCYKLLERIKQLKDLDLHFFGHIHSPGGQQVHLDGISYYNAAICDERYYPSNPITIVDYIKD